jgi:type VI secretion system protein ImpA
MSGETMRDDALPPISEDDPCGPDLDLEGDSDFLNYMASAAGQLPASYFRYDPDKDGTFLFDPKSIDSAALEATARQLLARSQDVRLLVMLAKLAILNRDLAGFAHWIAATACLFADHWDAANPRGEDGDFAARFADLNTLDDMPVVILPLHYAPLAATQRDGALTYRAQLAASGQASLLESERALDASGIARVFENCDLAALAETLATLRKIGAALSQIRAIAIDKAGHADAPTFKDVSPLIADMTAFVQGALARRDPTVAAPEAPASEGGEEQQTAAAVTTSFDSFAEADAALASALAYFVRSEPSSAAVLLIGQARQLLGKNIYEVMKILAPAHADAARVFVGAEPGFTVPVSAVAAGEGTELATGEVEPAESRAAALGLIDAVASYLRKVEPSSPVPLLLDQARALTSRDFLGLLKELMPEDVLAQMRRGGASE